MLVIIRHASRVFINATPLQQTEESQNWLNARYALAAVFVESGPIVAGSTSGGEATEREKSMT